MSPPCSFLSLEPFPVSTRHREVLVLVAQELLGDPSHPLLWLPGVRTADVAKTTGQGQNIHLKDLCSLGLLAHLLRSGGWGGCQKGLTTEPEDMVGALGG